MRYPAPAAYGPFSYEGDGLTVYFEDASVHDIREWAWNFGENGGQWTVDSSQGNTVYTYGEEGTYEVCLAVRNPRGRDTTCQEVVVTTTSVDGALAADFRLSPNPTSGVVHLAHLPEQVDEVVVVNALGQVVERVNSTPGAGMDRLDLSALPDGVYVVQLQRAGQVLGVQKLVKTE